MDASIRSIKDPDEPSHSVPNRLGSRLGLGRSDRRILLLLGDSVVASIAAVVSLWFWTFTSGDTFGWAYLEQKTYWLLLTPVIWILLINQNLSPRPTQLQGQIQALFSSAVIGLVLYLALYFFVPRYLLPRLYILYFLALAFGGGALWRWLFVSVFHSSLFRRRALLLGPTARTESILALLSEHWPEQYDIVALMDYDTSSAAWSGAELVAAAREQQVSEIILGSQQNLSGKAFQALLDCQADGIVVTPMLSLYERVSGKLPITDVEADWMIASFLDRVRSERWFLLAKRMMDIAGALIGLAGLALICPFVILVVFMESGRPILFNQIRMGQSGRPFLLHKFRTMRLGAESDGQARWAQPADERVTQVGRWLRRTHLDEAPQFLNVLMGEMSLVGPRPERPEFYDELERNVPYYRARLLVKPGITGWAQVNYSYSTSIDETFIKLQYDLYYIKHQSLWLDLAILFRTVGVVLSFQGT